MSGMPYSFEQGTVLSLLDDFLSDERRSVATLAALRPRADGSLLPLVQCVQGFDAPVLQQIPDPLDPTSTITAATHVDEHWFGNGAAGAWWQGWTGDAEEIVRWTVISALEISLGVPHVGPDEPPAVGAITPTRHWPVHLHWACGAALFQGWVGWHKHGRGRTAGVVNVVFTTPGVGKKMFATPRDPDRGGARPGDYEDPATTVGDHGLWVVGQERTKWRRSPTSTVLLGNRVGAGVLPANYGLQLESTGDVCIVAPSEATGGVLRKGRKY